MDKLILELAVLVVIAITFVLAGSLGLILGADTNLRLKAYLVHTIKEMRTEDKMQRTRLTLEGSMILNVPQDTRTFTVQGILLDIIMSGHC